MDLKIEEKKVMKKEDLAELLVRLGEGLEKGRLLLPGPTGKIDLTVKEPLEVEIEYREKHGRSKFELEVKWPSGEAASIAQPLAKAADKLETRKALKREMKAILYEVEKAVNSRRMAGAKSSFQGFQELNNRFNELAEKGWEKEVKAQNVLVTALGKALTEENAAAAAGAVDKLWRLKKACHSKYKEY